MSEEIATMSDTEGAGAGVVAAFVIGGIVATASWAAVAGISRFRAWNAVRKEKREQEELEVKVEKAVQKKTKDN